MPKPAEERAALVEALTAWLEAERLAAVKNFADKEVTLTRKLRRVFAHREFTLVSTDDGKKTGTWSVVKSGEEDVAVSRFHQTAKYITMRWKGTLPSPLGEPTETGSSTQETDEKTLEDRDWFVRCMLGEYFTHLNRLDEPEPALATRIVSEYLDYLFGDRVELVEELICGGFMPPGEIASAPDCELQARRMTSEELGAMLAKHLAVDAFTEGDYSQFLYAFEKPFAIVSDFAAGCVLSCRRQTSRAHVSDGKPRLERVVLALQLMGFTVSGRGVVTRRLERGPNRGIFPEEIQVPQMPEFEEKEITLEDLRRADSIASSIPSTFSEPRVREEVALHQFSAGAAQQSDAEAVISFTIALEALLVPGLQGENAFRFRLNGARYLASHVDDRRVIYDDLKRLYSLRSKLVHGGASDKEELSDSRKTARSLAAIGLLKALSEGWPTGADFESAALQ